MGEFDQWVHSKQTPPQPGEVIVTCGHGTVTPIIAGAFDPYHQTGWVELAAPVVISGPSETFESRWITACEHCLERAGGDWRKVEIRDHFRWNGEASPAQKRADLEGQLACSTDDDLLRMAAQLPEFRGKSRRQIRRALRSGSLIRLVR